MCLEIYQKSRPRVLVAKADIVSYKVLRVEGEGTSRVLVTSPYLRARYRFVEDGRSVWGPETLTLEGESGCWYVNRGLHSFTEFHHAERDCYPGRYVFVSVIPKGSKYYRGHFRTFLGKGDCYVSDQLIVYRRDTEFSQRYIRNIPRV